jgi:hypothetical protein
MPEQTVLHGIDQQGPSNLRPTNAPDGFVFFDRTIREPIVWDGTLKTWLTVSGRALYSAASPRMLADDFKAPALDTRWGVFEGDDDLAALPALVSGSAIGEVALVSGNAGDTVAHDASVLTSPVVFAAEDGAITLKGRLKVNDKANTCFFFGLSDEAKLEMPATLATTTYTTNATDAVGFLYDTAATTDTIRAVGVANNTDATHVDTAIAPVNDTYLELEIRVTAAGVATFYINGVLKATVEDAVTPDVDLCVIAAVTARTTASRTLTLDYVTCQQ